MTLNRNYSYSDVAMLTTAKTIAENFRANIAELASVRTDWTPERADSVNLRIDNATEKLLGTDAQKALRSATSALKAIHAPARRDLSFFKTQIDDDFKDDPLFHDEILNTLGFQKYLKKVQKDNQESVTQLLYTFKTNMTDELKSAIAAKGMNPEMIDRIIGYATSYSVANVNQEVMKQTGKEVTSEVTDEFNAIYAEIIGICKKASKYYRYEPLKRELFTFSKIAAQLGNSSKVKPELSED